MQAYFTILALLAQLGMSALSLSAAAQDASRPDLPWVNGEIRKVDSSAGKLTIRHADIPNLAMPGMTMVFRVSSPALLEHAHAGDQVRFTADRVDGALTVISIEPR